MSAARTLREEGSAGEKPASLLRKLCVFFGEGIYGRGRDSMNYKLLEMQVHGDRRGKLISLEGMQNVPFEIKRIYYMFDTLPNEARGFHAHRELEQIVIAMDGACRFVLDDGEKREAVLLNRPDVGLYIGKNMWREMHDFSYGCKLVVLASEHYDEKEYIRNYDEFLKSLREAK